MYAWNTHTRYYVFGWFIYVLLLASCDNATKKDNNSINNINNTNNINSINNTNNTNNINNTNNNPCGKISTSADDVVAYENLLACLRNDDIDLTLRAQSVETFIQLVENRGGFPIRTQGEVIFFYVASSVWDVEDDAHSDEDFDPQKRREPITVAGDFNDWDSETVILQSENLGVYHARLSFIPRETRSRYKFVARNDQNELIWFSDPLSRRFLFDENGRISLIHSGIDENGFATGHLEWIREVPSQRLHRTRSIYLYLPPHYEDQPHKQYPVLYMHDGNNLFDTAFPRANGSWEVDETADALIQQRLVRPFIVVGIPNNEYRMDEYTHVTDIIEGQTMGGQGRDYAFYITEELKPVIDARYRTLPERTHTAVLGSSLGGLISFAIAYWYPDVFGWVGGMSSTFGWGRIGADNDLLQDWYAVEDLIMRNQVYYLDSGGGLVQGTSCVDPIAQWRDNYCETIAFRDMLVSKGINTFPDDPDANPLTPENINIYHWHEMGAPHNESAWANRLHRPLRLFFGM